MKGNKTILGSILVIGLVSIILAGSYTGAFFMDVETSEDNSFSSGLLDMKIGDNDESFKDGVTGTWTADDLKPGDEKTFYTEFIDLEMFWTSTIDANHTEITCNYTVDDNGCTEAEGDVINGCNTSLYPDSMAKNMIITRCVYKPASGGCINCLTGNKYNSYDSTNHICVGAISETNPDWKIKDTDGDGKQTFYDLKTQRLDNLPPVVNSPNSRFEMSVKFNKNAGNEFQTDIFNLTMKFILNQDSSQ